ncbi:MAG: DUF5050 domain-containing protein [Eubacteriales bacterium]|jgi:hypothetical protein|nr:DUF5050 domain-containing protein [Eubacteriales bacterium]MDD4104367.1 DUF5050 domain-containing protein [Eubacteriales bacterium]MDD4709686.1 DUF5050 domain-containing protein [Eubacteriales bacterium]NLO15213.1 DUF5050 domain-containing protein [Clostridiales bacterium]
MKKQFLVIITLVMLSVFSAAHASPVITTEMLTNGMAGVFYSAKITADGQQPISFELAYNNDGTSGLPGGLKLAKNGTIYGNPGSTGTYTFSVYAISAKGEAAKAFTLSVRPFDENQLRKGGDNASILGEGADSVVGIANALSGGRVTLQGDTVYFIDKKGYLNESPPPYTRSSKRFKATKYESMDSAGDNLYYYQRYLDTKGTAPDGSDNTFVTRIARDPLGDKGRSTLINLTQKEMTTLSVTNEIILFVKGEKPGTMVRLPLDGGGDRVVHAYNAGRELDVLGAIPYNGYAYFQAAQDGSLYRMYLDGEIAQRLTNERIGTFTIARREGEDVLCYTNETGTLVTSDLDGSNALPFPDYRAAHLNADEEYLYFTDAANKNRVVRVNLATPREAEILADLSADQLYIFDESVVLRKKGSEEFYILSKKAGSEPVRLNKENKY